MKFYTLFFIFFSFYFFSHAQIASYPFANNVNDESSNANHITFHGTPSFLEDDGADVIQLDGDEYMELPTTVNQSIDPSSGFSYAVRFKITDDYDISELDREKGHGRRVIIANKMNDIRYKGFELYFGKWFGAPGYYLIASYGDGTFSGGQSHEVVHLITEDVNVGDWYEVSVKFNLTDETPNVTHVVNGVVNTTLFNSGFNLNNLIESLTEKPIRLGTGDDIGAFAPNAEVIYDYAEIYSPIPNGNTTAVNNALVQLTQHLQGNIPLTESEKNNLLSSFVSNWDLSTYQSNTLEVLNFIETYNNIRGTLFSADFEMVNPSELDVEGKMLFTIEQWMLDNLYTAGNVSNMDGISFLDHTVFPGSVATVAPRLSKASFLLDGNYQTDPGFYLNNQERVIRPIGYYAPPGELVTVDLPANMVNTGVKIQVGVHSPNLGAEWDMFRRFPRISTSFNVTSTTVTVANPFGGGIYFVLPDGSALGTINGQITGAVKSPYYCTKAGFETSLIDFQNDINNAHVPWIDIESDKFMITSRRAVDFNFSQTDQILNNWNLTMDAFNIVAGRPLDRFRSEYLVFDLQAINPFTVAGAQNPMFYPDYAPTFGPFRFLNTDVFHEDFVAEAILHEMGHLHNMPTLSNETEANVHIPKIATWNLYFGKSLDEAFTYGGPQRISRDQAATDWMITELFKRGERIGYSPYNVPGIVTNYQARGYARNIDIVDLYDWNTLGTLNGYFYTEAQTNTDFNYYNIDDDDFIRKASQATGHNMAPLFEFWGVLPSNELVQELATDYPNNEDIKYRICHYRSLIPQNKNEMQDFYDDLLAIYTTFWLGSWEDQRLQNILASYDETYVTQIEDRFNTILNKYFADSECPLPVLPEERVMTLDFKILPNPAENYFEIVLPENSSSEINKIEIFDYSGRLVLERKIDNNAANIQIKANQLSSSLYLIKVNYENNSTAIKKLIKK